MKNYHKFFIILYLAITLLVSGFLFINTQEELITKETGAFHGAKSEKYIIPEKNYKPFEYSLLGFSVGALVIYAIFLIKKR
jgi:formate/nitrite transporter FocA (FNT family)